MVHSIFWVGLAIFVLIYSDLIRVLRIDPRVIRPLLYLCFMTWAGVLGLVFYLAVFLPCCKGAKVDDYNVTHPEHIKAVLVLTLITFVSFSISI